MEEQPLVHLTTCGMSFLPTSMSIRNGYGTGEISRSSDSAPIAGTSCCQYLPGSCLDHIHKVPSDRADIGSGGIVGLKRSDIDAMTSRNFLNPASEPV